MHFWPQSHFILNRAGEPMMDFVGRFENIRHDFAEVARRLGRAGDLAVTNESIHEDYTKYYSDKTRAVVQRVYERDIAAFGYQFGGVR